MKKKRFYLLAFCLLLSFTSMQARKYYGNELSDRRSTGRTTTEKHSLNTYQTAAERYAVPSTATSSDEGSLRGAPGLPTDPEFGPVGDISYGWMILFAGMYLLGLNYRKKIKKQLQ
jgi:hypothetical protein